MHKVHQVNGDKGCRFRTEAGVGKTDRLETEGKRKAYFIHAEVSLGADKHKGIFIGVQGIVQRKSEGRRAVPGSLFSFLLKLKGPKVLKVVKVLKVLNDLNVLKDFLFQDFFLAVAMGNELLPLECLVDEAVERYHLVEYRFRGLEALLHGGNKNLVETLRLHHMAFGVAAAQQTQFVEAYLCCFFCQPFQAIHVLRGADGQMKMSLPQRGRGCLTEDIHIAPLPRCVRNNSLIEVPRTVRQLHMLSYAEAQHTQGMGCFLFGQLMPRGDIGTIEKGHLRMKNKELEIWNEG